MAKNKKKDKKEVEETIEKVEIHEEEVKTPPTTEELFSSEKDKNLRLFAEFENFRKRNARERIELFSTANKDIMTALIPVLDNFERSITANNYSEEDGTVLIYNQFKTELEKKGTKRNGEPNRKRIRYRIS